MVLRINAPPRGDAADDSILRVLLIDAGAVRLHVFAPDFVGKPTPRASGPGHLWREGDATCCRTVLDRSERSEQFAASSRRLAPSGTYRVFAEITGDCGRVGLRARVEVSGSSVVPGPGGKLSSEIVAKGNLCEAADLFQELMRFEVRSGH